VMYAGKVVEDAPVGELFGKPLHPYTQGLIRSIPRIDTAALEKYLGFKIGKIEQFKGGQSNPTYKINDQYVLRRKPPGKLLPSAHAVDREFKVISALHKVGFPVARPHVLCEDESVIGTAFYVMEYVEGRVLWDPALPGMTREQRAAIWDEKNRVISQLHNIDYRAVGLEDFGKPGNYIGRQVERWSKQYRASETQRIEAMDHLIDWLATSASTTPSSTPPRRASSPCSTGSSRRSATRSPTSPTTAWASTSRPTSSAASPALISRSSAFPARPST